MSKIALLADEVVNKIAAGEIIERPVSIVKELVENSLDAGATEIRIDIERGGKQLIRISDNGCGIASEEALLAFERHATSKIQSPEDLHQISTMGFRGEALASIAAVSQVQLKTRRSQETAGVSLFLVGGKCQSQQPAALPQGTIFEARNLFFNTPARKKFLKTDGTEAAAITHMVQAFAMANPEISFFLRQDQREVLACPATTTLKERIYQIFGAEMLDQLIELDQTLFHFHLRGFVSNTNSLRSNKNYQYFFINRRLVKDKVLSNSVYVAYRVYAETGQYPAAFLFLEIPAAMVDVNVHPAKYEVRFLQQSLVQKGIIDAIQRALSDSRPLPSFQLTGNPYIPRYSAPELNLPSASSAMEIPDEISPATPGMSMPAPPARKMPQQGEYKIIGQYDNTYVVLSDEGGLILVDQHVAHERVLYELLLRKEEAHEMHRQNLLIPLVIELNPAQMMLMEDYTNHFRDLGFDLELFGNGTIIVRQIPELLADANYSAAIQRLLNDLEKLYRDGVLESFAEQMRKSMACQAAVKINMPLTKEKMEWLIAELLKTRTPQVCPHGRPIILRISHYEIEKNFRRI
jgi:DNA mismatch repair protein MutL